VAAFQQALLGVMLRVVQASEVSVLHDFVPTSFDLEVSGRQRESRVGQGGCRFAGARMPATRPGTVLGRLRHPLARCPLRPLPSAEQASKARRGPQGNSSKFRGVTRHRRTQRWEVGGALLVRLEAAMHAGALCQLSLQASTQHSFCLACTQR
jgi:hypothetical protein